MRRAFSVLAALILGGNLAAPALAATLFSESGDVGDQTSTAAILGSFNTGDTILGQLTSDTFNADLFSISLTAGVSFTATVSDPFFDSQLFLFNATGQGITGNDNSGPISLNAAFAYTPTTSGTYYLAISGADFDPIGTSGNFMFGNNFTGPSIPVQNAGALSSWVSTDGFDPNFGNYTITLLLSGATEIPEPSMLPGLIGLAGGLGLVIFKRRQQV